MYRMGQKEFSRVEIKRESDSQGLSVTQYRADS